MLTVQSQMNGRDLKLHVIIKAPNPDLNNSSV